MEKHYDTVNEYKHWLNENKFTVIYTKPISVCQNCKNQKDNYCSIWRHEIRWCGSCKHHELNK